MKHIGILVSELNKKEYTSTKQKLMQFQSEIFDLATGGDFESTTRKPSKPTAMNIHRLCADIRAHISALGFKI